MTLINEIIVGLGYGIGGAVAKEFKKVVSERKVLYTGDQSDAEFLKKMMADVGKQFDIIVDDGSHVPWHQIFTFETIFKTWLKPGGIYVIEDIETSYWNSHNAKIYGYDIIDTGVGKRGSAVEKLKVKVFL